MVSQENGIHCVLSQNILHSLGKILHSTEKFCILSQKYYVPPRKFLKGMHYFCERVQLFYEIMQSIQCTGKKYCVPRETLLSLAKHFHSLAKVLLLLDNLCIH